ncbi:phospholipase D-like domain-containing protein [Halobacillus halophilus]|uniref:phospholipase D-like domain-containing protein n=1 Tax=Halobacillus halophilus TaxID=1570 RepID=UPI001CD73943|nr:phospholipase D-like domain-containing protein [Halobacillus halophilus]MCA1010281.1 phospholipase D-like domain-containing protein [Halobacillus halophilus]
MEILITAGCSILASSYITYRWTIRQKKETYSLSYFLSKTKRSPLKEIIETIQNAEKTIDVAIFLFSNNNIAAELIQAAKRGVKVRVFTDREQLKSFGAQIKNIKELTDNGVAVRTNTHDGTMHIKMLISDHMHALVGSYNFTYNAERKNDEILLRVDDERMGQQLCSVFEDLWQDGVNWQFYKNHPEEKIS